MPANGWVTPHIRFCTAIASANVSRPQCRSALIGCRNSPKPWRMPMPTVRIRPPQTRTTVGERQLAGEIRAVDIIELRFGLVAVSSGRGMERFDLGQCGDQRVQLGG